MVWTVNYVLVGGWIGILIVCLSISGVLHYIRNTKIRALEEEHDRYMEVIKKATKEGTGPYSKKGVYEWLNSLEVPSVVMGEFKGIKVDIPLDHLLDFVEDRLKERSS